MPTPDQSVTYKHKRNTFFCIGRELKAFLSQRKAEDLCFLEINIFRVAFFYFLLQIKVKIFFGNILFKSEYFDQF